MLIVEQEAVKQAYADFVEGLGRRFNGKYGEEDVLYMGLTGLAQLDLRGADGIYTGLIVLRDHLSDLCGLNPSVKFTHEVSYEGYVLELDVYSLSTFLHTLVGNVKLQVSLYAPKGKVWAITPVMEQVRSAKDLFLSAELLHVQLLWALRDLERFGRWSTEAVEPEEGKFFSPQPEFALAYYFVLTLFRQRKSLGMDFDFSRLDEESREWCRGMATGTIPVDELERRMQNLWSNPEFKEMRKDSDFMGQLVIVENHHLSKLVSNWVSSELFKD